MCGITGIFHHRSGQGASREFLQAMTDAIAHRGPDGSGLFLDGPVGLGHRRLSIIDLSTGDQPMADADERLWIVFNGEIYNFLELRTELEGLGHRFRTRSDTEVILKAYRQWGTECVTRLRGMFAFALWDAEGQQLFLTRDRVGKKPLYYTEAGGAFLFASEAKSILTYPGVPREVNLAALDDFLAYQYVPAPETIFQGIYKLEPGHAMTVDSRGVKRWRYWDLDFADQRDRSDQQVLAELTPLLAESVRLRLISDVPLGAFLSGGIDSSIVVALMARQSSQPVRTFSIGFTEQAFNELPYARQVAERYGTQHEEFTCTSDLVGVLPELVYHFDEPFADSSAIPTYYLAKMTRQRVTVALNGDGGDEGFAGYERYLGDRYVRLWHRLPDSVRRRLLGPALDLFGAGTESPRLLRRVRRLNQISLEPAGRRYARNMLIFPDAYRRSVLSAQVQAKLGGRDAVAYTLKHYQDSRLRSETDRMLYSDTMTYLPGDLLVKVDRMTMRFGLEGRSPLLDHKVLEFAASLPGQRKLRGVQLKYYLKQVAAELLPAQLLNRPKMGFGVPISGWFRGNLAPWVREVLGDPAVVRAGLLDDAAVARLVAEHTGGAVDHGHRLWALINLELWYRMFIQRQSMGALAPSPGTAAH